MFARTVFSSHFSRAQSCSSTSTFVQAHVFPSTRCFKSLQWQEHFIKRMMSRRGHYFSLQSTGLKLVIGVWLRTVCVSLFVKCGIPICCCSDHFSSRFSKAQANLKGRRFSSGRFSKAIMVDQKCDEQTHFQVHVRTFVVFKASPHSRRSHVTRTQHFQCTRLVSTIVCTSATA